MRKTNPCKANHAHVGINVLENALRREDEPDSEADEQNSRRTLRWSQ
jgi:hypothetical protein